MGVVIGIVMAFQFGTNWGVLAALRYLARTRLPLSQVAGLLGCWASTSSRR